MVLYFCSILFWLQHSIRNRSLNFFVYSNPKIPEGGMLDERKTDIYKYLEKKIIPKMILIQPKIGIEKICEKLKDENIYFPVFIKPNIGCKGLFTQRINSESQLSSFLSKFKKKEFLIQEFIDLSNEYSILYYKFPNKIRGISSFCSREYPYVIGDGNSSIIDLIKFQNNDRVNLTYIHDYLNNIPEKNIKVVLDYVGNYIRGSRIIDRCTDIDDALIKAIDDLLSPIDGLNFVRIDLKANSILDIKNGGCKILEINGAKSEPLHMYDEKYKLKEKMIIMKNHWKLLSDISMAYKPYYSKHSVFISIRSVFNLFFKFKIEK